MENTKSTILFGCLTDAELTRHIYSLLADPAGSVPQKAVEELLMRFEKRIDEVAAKHIA